MTDHVEPTDKQLADLASFDRPGPVIMLNLNKYRDIAGYPPELAHLGGSGRDAYARYAEVALQAIAHLKAEVLWMAAGEQVVIGCDHDAFDDVIAVRYPSRAAFLELANFPGYLDALVHRTAGLERAAVIACNQFS